MSQINFVVSHKHFSRYLKVWEFWPTEFLASRTLPVNTNLLSQKCRQKLCGVTQIVFSQVPSVVQVPAPMGQNQLNLQTIGVHSVTLR